MPVSIPTYYATQFVKNASLSQRRMILKKSYTFQYFLISVFTMLNYKRQIKK